MAQLPVLSSQSCRVEVFSACGQAGLPRQGDGLAGPGVAGLVFTGRIAAPAVVEGRSVRGGHDEECTAGMERGEGCRPVGKARVRANGENCDCATLSTWRQRSLDA